MKEALVARARGLGTRLLSAELLAEIDAATDPAPVFARAGLPAVPDEVDVAAHDRIARDAAILARWSTELGDAPARRHRTRAPLAPLWLDEDRRSLRAIIRGLAAHTAPRRRLAGTMPTPNLPPPVLAELAEQTDLHGIARVLEEHDHPYAAVVAGKQLDPLSLELALGRCFGDLARPRDRAMRAYVRQAIDAENAEAALLIAARGKGVTDAFVRGGELIDRRTFDGACRDLVDEARARLAEALESTPLAAALFDAAPGAVADATLRWQLATQAKLRRLEPLSLAP
ncbi:MAG TPA: V-type ATPase subunit, partial [Kofleriaceae bacterium]|nr:V-type ATPase subunit [Kofleriaceae bacterium]